MTSESEADFHFSIRPGGIVTFEKRTINTGWNFGEGDGFYCSELAHLENGLRTSSFKADRVKMH